MGQGRDPKSNELYLLQVLNRIDASIQGISGTPGGGGGSYPENTIDATNSSTAVLGAGAVFTGAAVEITDFAAINVSVFSDVASATDGLEMQFSPDGTNWDHIHTYSVSANTSYSYNQASEMKFFRIKYTNGAAAQSFFRLQVILKVENVMPSRYTVEQAVKGGQLADIVKGVIYGQTTGGGGGYVAVKVNPSGALTVEATIDPISVTPNIIRATGAGSIPAGARSFSIANVGAADGDILGGTNNIKAGEVLNFDAGLNNTYGAVAYDATGTELLITYNN